MSCVKNVSNIVCMRLPKNAEERKIFLTTMLLPRVPAHWEAGVRVLESTALLNFFNVANNNGTESVSLKFICLIHFLDFLLVFLSGWMKCFQVLQWSYTKIWNSYNDCNILKKFINSFIGSQYGILVKTSCQVYPGNHEQCKNLDNVIYYRPTPPPGTPCWESNTKAHFVLKYKKFHW